MNYTKPPYTIDQKANLLIKRGLIVSDELKLKKYLSDIGYFRMTGYLKYYQDTTIDRFYDDVTFEQVLDLYIFDRKLRLLMLDVIEKIEVSIKARIGDYMSIKYGVFWHVDGQVFNTTMKKKTTDTSSIYDEWIKIVSDKKRFSQSVFIKAYNDKYCHEGNIPSRMLFEELTLGEVATLYKILNNDDAREIGNMYNTYFQDLRLRLLLLVNIRNISAHHARLRNRKYITRLDKNDAVFKHIYQKETTPNGTIEVIPNFFNTSLIINHLLQSIIPSHDFINKLSDLFNEFPSVQKQSMGFNDDRKKYFT